MNWVRGDNYHLKADGWTICRVNLGPQCTFELWNTATKECVASVKADNEVEAKRVVRELKEMAV